MLVKAGREPNAVQMNGEFRDQRDPDAGFLQDKIRDADRRAEKWGARKEVAGFIHDRFDDALRHVEPAFPGDKEERKAQGTQKAARTAAKIARDYSAKKQKEAAAEAKVLRDIQDSVRDARDRSPRERAKDNERAERYDRWSRTG